MGPKVYFLPQVRAKVTNTPVMDLLTRAIEGLHLDVPWSKATSYFATLPAGYGEPAIAAVDCVPDTQNRFKVYVRTLTTHLSVLCDMLTLRGKLEGPTIDATLAELRKLWRELFGPASDDTPVKQKQSDTGPTGFLFYYETAPGNCSPIPKIYIPAARFLESDEHAAQVLSNSLGAITTVMFGHCCESASDTPHFGHDP
jgi:DMATS type aromatic prenyltransferase